MTIDFSKSFYMMIPQFDTEYPKRVSQRLGIEIISSVSENLLSLLFVNTYIGIGRQFIKKHGRTNRDTTYHKPK